MKLNRLTEHVQSTIYEGMLKLGGFGMEMFSIYYDLDLLNYLLETDFASNEDCFDVINTLYNEEPASTLMLALTKNRFRFTAKPEALPSIYETGEKNQFLHDLITLVNTHSFTLTEVKHLFHRYSADYCCDEVSNSEFQYVLYFPDKEINQYKYCFSFDECGGYYHRLLDFDYNRL